MILRLEHAFSVMQLEHEANEESPAEATRPDHKLLKQNRSSVTGGQFATNSNSFLSR